MSLREPLAAIARAIDVAQRKARVRLLVEPQVRRRGMQLDPDVFRGRRVAIVGPAETVRDETASVDLDAYDLIVRLNNGIALAEAEPETFGRRTDILFHNLKEEGERSAGAIPASRLRANGTRLCVYPHRGAKSTLKRAFAKDREWTEAPDLRMAVPDLAFCLALEDALDGYKPTAGASAILVALAGRPRELAIFGFTFFETPYAAGYNDAVDSAEAARAWVAVHGVHDPRREKALVRQRLEAARAKGTIITLGAEVERRLMDR